MRNNLSRSGKRRYWEKHLEQWRGTDLSEPEYCRKYSIKLRTFRYWKRKSGSDNSKPTLVELPIQNLDVPLLGSSPRLCVVVNQNLRIEIEKGFDPEELERVVRVLRCI